MSCNPKSKTQQAVSLLNAGDLKGCLRIVAGWRPSSVLSREELKVLKTGYESFVHAGLMRQMGLDPVGCIESAEKLFRSKFIKENV